MTGTAIERRLAVGDRFTVAHVALGQNLYLQSRLILTANPLPTGDRGAWHAALPIPAPVDGVTRTLRLTHLDAAGNRSDPVAASVWVDTVRPVLTVRDVQTTIEGRPGRSTAPVISGRVSDDGGPRAIYALVTSPTDVRRIAAVQTTAAGTGGTSTGSLATDWQFALPAGAAGRYTIRIAAVDRAGNTSQVGPYAVTVRNPMTPRLWLPFTGREGARPAAVQPATTRPAPTQPAPVAPASPPPTPTPPVNRPAGSVAARRLFGGQPTQAGKATQLAGPTYSEIA